MRIPIGYQTWPEDTQLTAENLVNCYAAQNPRTARTPIKVTGCPGVSTDTTTGLPSSYMRGLIEQNINSDYDIPYCVFGTDLYSLNSSGTATKLNGATTIDGTANLPVIMERFRDKLVICGVNKGSGATGAYEWDGSTFTDIQAGDADLDGSLWVANINNYAIYGDVNTDKFQWSALDDPTSIDALHFAEAESRGDKTLRGIAYNNELLLFGEHTLEIFQYTGDADNLFLRAGGGIIETGCRSTYGVAVVAGRIFWVADDSAVYTLNGRVPVRISTPGLEEVLETDAYSVSTATSYPYVWGMSYSGRDFFVIKYPGEWTYAYDLSTGLWHQRQTDGENDWQGTWFARAYGEAYISHGDTTTSEFVSLDNSIYTENGSEITARVDTPFLENAGKRVSNPRLRLGVAVDNDTRQNLIANSEDFTVDMTAENATVAANLITEDSTAGVAHGFRSDTLTVDEGPILTLSVDLKEGVTRDWAQIIILNAATNKDVRAWFDLANGVVGSYSESDSTVDYYAHSISDAGSGWYRCELTACFPDATGVRVYVRTAESDGSVTHDGDGASTVNVNKLQLEHAVQASTYKTTSGTAYTNEIELSWTEDGTNYNTSRSRILHSDTDGLVDFNRLGSFRKRAYRIEITDPVQRELYFVEADINAGR